jgi:hypothetical protein
MARAKNSSKRNGRKRAAPALGIAGVSLAMASGASASTAGSAVDVPVQKNTATHHELFLGEEEISDVSLSTFYVFDKENDATLKAGVKTAQWGCRCGGCARGCRCGWRGCGGCGGCGGCCASWGRCRWC